MADRESGEAHPAACDDDGRQRVRHRAGDDAGPSVSATDAAVRAEPAVEGEHPDQGSCLQAAGRYVRASAEAAGATGADGAADAGRGRW